jgi:hypothetical protein
MGTVTDLLTVALEPGGPATVLAAALVAWLQRRRGNQTVSITRPDGGTVTVAAENVRGLTAEQVGELAQQLARALEPGAAGSDDEPVTGTDATGSPSPDSIGGGAGEDTPPDGAAGRRPGDVG